MSRMVLRDVGHQTFQKFQKCLKLLVRNASQSSPILTIIVPLCFMITSLIFFYLSKLLFSCFVEFEENIMQHKKY